MTSLPPPPIYYTQRDYPSRSTKNMKEKKSFLNETEFIRWGHHRHLQFFKCLDPPQSIQRNKSHLNSSARASSHTKRPPNGRELLKDFWKNRSTHIHLDSMRFYPNTIPEIIKYLNTHRDDRVDRQGSPCTFDWLSLRSGIDVVFYCRGRSHPQWDRQPNVHQLLPWSKYAHKKQ